VQGRGGFALGWWRVWSFLPAHLGKGEAGVCVEQVGGGERKAARAARIFCGKGF